jgi:hypothetical protein
MSKAQDINWSVTRSQRVWVAITKGFASVVEMGSKDLYLPRDHL